MRDETGETPINAATPAASGPGPKLTREDRMTLALLRAAASLVEIERQLVPEDFKRIPALGAFLAAAYDVIDDLGFGKDID